MLKVVALIHSPICIEIYMYLLFKSACICSCAVVYFPSLLSGVFFSFITPILESLVVPVIWLALIGAIYSWITPLFALNCIFFPANEKATLKTKQPIRFQGLFKVTNQIAGKWKTKSIMWEILQLLFPKLLFPPPPKKKKKIDEFNFKRAQYCINEIFELTKSWIWAISKWM